MTWYDTASGPSGSTPGSILAQEAVRDFTEFGGYAIPDWNNPGFWIHVFQYTGTLATPWAQQQGETYFLSIVALYEGDDWPMSAWCVLDHDTVSGAGMQRLMMADWYPATYWMGHRLEDQPMDMAFRLRSGPPPTPSPSPSLTPFPSLTPTPSPTPTLTPRPSPSPTPDNVSWNQPPDTSTGTGASSSQGTDPRRAASVLVADDWQSAGPPVGGVRFWGYYEWWQSHLQVPTGPPDDLPSAFQVTLHEYLDGYPPTPGNVLAQQTFNGLSGTYLTSFENPGMMGSYHHVYAFECTFDTPWEVPEGHFAFLSVQAIYATEWPMNGFAWLASSAQFNAAAMQKSGGMEWQELTWPDGYPLARQPMDMSFALIEAVLPSPTPSLTPTPTPTPSPSETPVVLHQSQRPNMVSGYDVPSHGDTAGTVGVTLADDWVPGTGDPIVAVRWWGSYPGWNEDSPAEVNSPASLEGLTGNFDWPDERPNFFEIALYEYVPTPDPHPGALVYVEECRSYSERWYGAVPRWDASGKYEHEYIYEANLANPWTLEPGTPYFLGIRAVTTVDPNALTYAWGWANSELQGGDPATQTHDGSSWSQLTWPTGHSFQGDPMNLAFETWSEPFVSATPTPSPTPTPVPTPSPSPVGWYTVTITAPHGEVSMNPDQIEHQPGTTVVLNAKGSSGYHFSHWSGDVLPGEESKNPLHLLVDSNKALTSHFVADAYTLEATVENGWVAITPQKSTYSHGEVVTVRAFFNTGFDFDRWNGNVPLAAGGFENPLLVTIDQDTELHAASINLDLGDRDGDGFSDAIEDQFGGDPDDPGILPDFGDWDGDGKTNMVDAILLARAAAAGPIAYDARFDLNRDGEVNSLDADLLLWWCVGMKGWEVLPVTR